MSEYFFGIGRGKVDSEIRDQIDAVCESHGVVFNNPSLPGDGPRYWFAGPNRGEPFDRRLRDAVWADLEEAGLVDDDGSLRVTAGEDEA